MNMPMSTGQMMVDQTPVFDKKRKKKPRRENQVMGKHLIHPDLRKKTKYV